MPKIFELENFSYRRYVIGSWVVVLILIGTVGLWSLTARISGAIISTGTVGVEQERQVVQHATGGTVTEIYVKEGDKVFLNQILFKLDDKVLQSDLTIANTKISSLTQQLKIIEEELKDYETLFAKGMVASTPLLKIKKEKASVEGDLKETLASKEKLLLSISKMIVYAPSEGLIYGLKIHMPGTVIVGAETVMRIVPSDAPLLVVCKIDPIDIENVFIGQEVRLRFLTYDRKITPEVGGKVTKVSADVFSDSSGGMSFYRVEVVPSQVAIADYKFLKLLPGMPVEAYLKTQDRTPLEFFIQPLKVYFGRAFRDDLD